MQNDLKTNIRHDTIKLLEESLLGLLAKIKCSICSYQFNI